MAEAPLVSVVIPAFNAASTLGQALTSAAGQTVHETEIIVVDDGSTDDTAEVARTFDDPRVRLVPTTNGGAAAARNAGIKQARARYVALLDADDLWLPHKLKTQLNVFGRYPHVHAIQAGAIFVNDSLQVLSRRPCRPSTDALLDTLRFQNMPNNMSTLVIERSMFDVMGLFDTSLVILEEWDMAIKVARYCNLYSVEEPLSLYRVHPGNRSRDLGIHIEPGFKVLSRLFDDPSLPAHIRQHESEIYARFYTMLAGGAFRNRSWRDCLTWVAKAMRTEPRMIGYMAAMPARKTSRLISRWQRVGSRGGVTA